MDGPRTLASREHTSLTDDTDPPAASGCSLGSVVVGPPPRAVLGSLASDGRASSTVDDCCPRTTATDAGGRDCVRAARPWPSVCWPPTSIPCWSIASGVLSRSSLPRTTEGHTHRLIDEGRIERRPEAPSIAALRTGVGPYYNSTLNSAPLLKPLLEYGFTGRHSHALPGRNTYDARYRTTCCGRSHEESPNDSIRMSVRDRKDRVRGTTKDPVTGKRGRHPRGDERGP